jgi:outer membrane biosynthesis protein TonB
VNSAISQEQLALLEDIDKAKAKLASLERELDGVEGKLDTLSGQREKFHLLDEICSSLDRLREMGAADLFWGNLDAGAEHEQHLAGVRASSAHFQKQIDAILQARESFRKLIQKQHDRIGFLNDDLLLLQEQEERARYDYVIEREERALPYRPVLMPWSRNGEDERRFRKTLALALLFSITFGWLVPLWELPAPDEIEVVEIPEHLVKLVKKEKPKPKPPEKIAEQKPREKSEEKTPAKKAQQPTVAETKSARKKAESTGILAFKDNFSDLLDDPTEEKLGASARLSNRGATATGDSSRSLVMAQAKSTSGGINTSALSRGFGGGAGKKLGGVAFSRVESAIGTDMVAEDRPLSDGPGPSRTDEEIQIVFDRYKAALYRIYNRELRNNPILKGKMVLRITIEPDGSVSLSRVESTDMDSPELSAKVVARVKNFNFGAKEGVPAITILYPIDFLPAT